MAAGPSADGADVFFTAPDGRGEAEFWNEADGAGSKARRRHRAPRKRPAPAHAATAAAPKGAKQRLAAAWAAETSARRALRGRSAGDGGPPRRNRKIAAGFIGVVALLALGLALVEANANDGGGSDQAAAESGGSGSGTDFVSSGSGSDAEAGTADQPVVESEIVDAPTTTRTGTKKGSKPATPATTAPKAADLPAATVPAPKPSGNTPAPSTPNPATPVPSTVAPTPTTAPPTPTTAAPKPPAAPTVQSFTAKPASSAGGACPPLQWATTFTWATTNASSVTIAGLLEATQANLPGDGSRVVCRLLPTPPLGGWTLTATGAGGSTTAKA